MRFVVDLERHEARERENLRANLKEIDSAKGEMEEMMFDLDIDGGKTAVHGKRLRTAAQLTQPQLRSQTYPCRFLESSINLVFTFQAQEAKTEKQIIICLILCFNSITRRGGVARTLCVYACL